MRVYWLLAALLVSAILAFLQFWAISDFLYWRYEWFDLPMHYLGGLAIAIFLIGFLYRKRLGLFTLGFVFIAIGWEVFEYVFGLPRESNYALDTVIDLIMDTLGAMTAYGVAHITVWRRTP